MTFHGKRTLLVIVIAALFLPSFGCAGRAYKKGYDELDKGNADKASVYFQKAVRRDPENEDYVFALGQSLLRGGHYKQAVDALEHAAELSPEQPEILDQLAFAFMKAGNRKRAIDTYWRLFNLTKHPPSVFKKLRPLLEEEERYGDAVEAAILASTHPNFPASTLTEMARDYFRKGLYPETEKLLTRAFELEPGKAHEWRLLGQAYLKMGDATGATKAFSQAFRLEPNDINAALGSAAALKSMGKIPEAITIYQRVVDKNPDLPDPRVELVKLLLSQGRTEEAMAIARDTFIRFPNEPEVQALKGAAHVAAGEWDKAIYILNRAQNSQSANIPWVHRALGKAYLGKGERALARQQFSAAVGRDSEDAESWLALCRMDLEERREQRGIERCKKAMKLSPGLRKEATRLMADFYEEQGRLMKRYEIESAGGEGETGHRLKQVINDLKAHQESLLSIPADQLSAREWFELGDVSEKLEDLDRAEKAFAMAWQKDPSNQEYRARMANILLIQGRFDSAVVHYRDIIRNNEHDVDARMALVQAYLGRGSAADALQVLKELRALIPGDPRVYELSAEALFALDQPEEAREMQRKANQLKSAGR